MSSPYSIVAVPQAELTETMTGSFVLIGTLVEPATHIVFDNQGTVSVAISFDEGDTTWKTFTAGASIVLDLKAAAAEAKTFVLPKGTAIYGNGASGTFSISYISAGN